jgi:crotonobetaine/carnitine-CoA ligase
MSDRSLRAILEQRATERRDQPFLLMKNSHFTFGEFNTECNRLANGLAAIGVSKGDVVSAMMPNSPELVLTWFAAAKLGAVFAPINTAFRGLGLAHMLNTTGSAFLVVDDRFLDTLELVAESLSSLKSVAVRGDASVASRKFPEWEVRALSEVFSDRADNPEITVRESDLLMLLFTSGTTGRSKACMLSHRYVLRQAELCSQEFALRSDDVLYCPFPLFHSDATIFTTIPALTLGATAALGERFSVSHFWEEIRSFGATVFDYMGATLTLLWKRDPQADDADNPARLAWGVPMPSFAEAFEKRFGLVLVDLYGLTEAGVPVYRRPGQRCPPGSCGRPIDAYELRIVDENGWELLPGEVGEVAIRPREPSLMMDGYYNMPDATLATFRDLWLHSGDLGYVDDEGFFYFAGRQKDAIRRRGENISSFEIEEVVDSHPAVLESAAFGIPSELTEEDVKVSVVLRPDTSLSPEDLIHFCEGRMAKFMLPRYVEFMTELPKTPTQKVEKHFLKEQHLERPVWDREASVWIQPELMCK